MKQRLQKVMADSGIASRRKCEELILDGHVMVNGVTPLSLPVLVDVKKDKIIVNGRRIKFQQRVYYILHKPKKVVCTNSDPDGRTRAIDLMIGVPERVFPVGRLDVETKGLIIMTNDGEFANKLTHPKYGVAKVYIAEVKGEVTGEDVERLKKGLWLDIGKAAIHKVRILEKGPRTSFLEVTLHEGRNRQVRRLLARVGLPVKTLTRVQIGNLKLKGIGPKKFRALTTREVNALLALAEPRNDKTKSGERPTSTRVRTVASSDGTSPPKAKSKKADKTQRVKPKENSKRSKRRGIQFETKGVKDE